MRIARKYLPPISLLLVSTLGVAYAATNLFTQTFPAVPSVEGITVHCTTLTPNLASVAASSSGFVGFDCSGTSPFGTTPAASINAPGGTISIKPSFTLPTPYLALFTTAPSGGTCSGGSQLTSGTAIAPGPTGAIFYCAQYTSAPSGGLPTFDITWTTPTTPFTQTFPALSAATAITNNCATLTPYALPPGSGTGPHLAAVATGSSGFVAFDCSGTSSFGTTPAFTVVVPSGTVTFTPQFTLPTPYVGLALSIGGYGGCDSITFGFGGQLTSGTAVTFPLTGEQNYFYCAQYTNAPSTGLPTLSISWSQ